MAKPEHWVIVSVFATGFVAAFFLASCSNASSASSSSSSNSAIASSSSSSTNITAIVLDSIGGSTIAGATITVTDSSGTTISPTASPYWTTESDGTLSLTSYLTIGSTYDITATFGSSYAASEMVNYVAESGSAVALYCHKLGISSAADTPPVINFIKYSTNSGASWSALSSGTTISGPFEIEACVDGAAAVKATSLSGFGIGIDIDQMPTSTNGYSTSSSSLVSALEDAVADTGTYVSGDYTTEDLFNFTGLTFLAGSHTLELVAYDVANNRVEERIPFTYE